ncbi:MAG: galactosyltransferase-related protein [Cyanobacteria bacterium P01_A01_bin.116]
MSLRDDISLQRQGAYKHKSYVSLCTSVKDRLDHLEKTFLQNIVDNQAYSNCEFLLLNYNCPNPNTEAWVKEVLTPYIETGKVSYYFFPDAPTFDRSHARNLAFRLAKGEIICNIDADNFIGTGFVAYVSAMLSQKNSFLCGPRDGRSLGGRICVHRKDFQITGGFDERFRSYGPEDLDFTKRLALSGLQKKVIQHEKFCGVIAHSDELRVKHHADDSDIKSKHDDYFAIMDENIAQKNICPNGSAFGQGKVKKNFSKWLNIS